MIPNSTWVIKHTPCVRSIEYNQSILKPVSDKPLFIISPSSITGIVFPSKNSDTF